MWTERTELLLGPEGLAKLHEARVVVVGTGGVGAVAAEMLVRAGVGSLVLVDNDTVSESNLNRQLVALRSTLGEPKCEVLRRRLEDINPDSQILCVREFLSEENIAEQFGRISAVPRNGRAQRPSFVVDAIDTLSPKIALIQYCLRSGIPFVSSMGSGAKTDATKVRIADISKTKICPLAHMLRKRLHKLGIREGFQAVYSEEEPRRESVRIEESRNKKSQVGTISYLPAVFGCVCAQAAIMHLAGEAGRAEADGTWKAGGPGRGGPEPCGAEPGITGEAGRAEACGGPVPGVAKGGGR